MAGVALVAGCAIGIGAGVARQLAREGYTVAAMDVRAPDETVAAISGEGGSARGYVCDVRDWDGVGAVVQQVEDEQGALTAAVAVAGVWETVPFLELTPETWHRVVDINLEGAFVVSRRAAEPMARRGAGAIVCISSNAAYMAWQGGVHYSASKAGIVGMVRAMAFELGPRGVRANAICPGTVWSGATDEVLRDPEVMAAQSRAHVIGRVGQPLDIAHAVAFLLDPVRAAWITGEAMLVDGGFGTHGEDPGFDAPSSVPSER